MQEKGRRMLRIHLRGNLDAGLRRLIATLKDSLSPTVHR